MILLALQIEWSHPAALLGLAALWFVWRWSMPKPGPVAGKRKLWRPLRATQIVLLVLGMTGPVLNVVSSRKCIVILHDISGSCANSAGSAELLRKLDKYEGIARIEHAYFQSPPYLEPIPTKAFVVPEEVGIDHGAERALAKVLAELPSGYIPEIILNSDGRFNHGDPLRVAAQNVPIHIAPLHPFDHTEVAVVALHAPVHAHPFESFTVESVVECTEPMDATLKIYRGWELVKEQAVKLADGTNRFVHSLAKDDEAFTEIRAEISSNSDFLPQNNVRRAIVATSPKLRVLIVDQDREAIGPFANRFTASGMDVKIISPGDLATALAKPFEIDLVVLSDIPANSYSNDQFDILHNFVHETGGGLIALGGRLSFEKARLEGSNIEPLLPVSPPIRPGKPRDTLAMVLVIDKSGSMLEEDRMRLAKEAAKESVKLLVATDKVGVVAFGDDFEWVSELAPCGDKREVFAKISGLKAEGRTNMYSAMIRAHLALDQAIADRKHAVILTDGVASPGDFEQLSKQMADAGITVSTISIGKDPDRSLLIDIARTARGRFHACNDPKEIREVLVEETLAAVDTEQKSVFAQVARQLPGLSIESAPALLGYSPTTTKPDSELLLWAADGDPLLAWWPYGVGRVAAFTSDVKEDWGRDWQAWDGATKYWTRVATLARRRAVPENVQISVARFDNRNHILVDAVDVEGMYWNEYLKVSLVNSSEEHVMKFIGPGRHQLQLPVTDHQKNSHFHLKIGSQIVPFAVAANYDNEYVVGPTNELLLRRIAAASGGTYDVILEDVFSRSDRSAMRSIPIWSYLAGLACLLFVIEIAIRRLLRPKYETTI